jgi:hypothetical protein
MAFEYAGSLYGATTPFIMPMQLSADCYVGQMVRRDANAGGIIEPMAAEAAGPDTTSYILGVVVGIRTSPTYSATYQGDGGTYDTTQATQVANDPIGACMADVWVIRPGDKIRAPICNATVGTAVTPVTVTTGSTDGLTFVGNTLTTSSVSFYSTAYCRSGANRGLYRRITTGGTTTQTMLVAFPYDIAAGDVFVVVNCAIPGSNLHWGIDSLFQGVNGLAALTNYYRGMTIELNLEESGREFIVFTVDPAHIASIV